MLVVSIREAVNCLYRLTEKKNKCFEESLMGIPFLFSAFLNNKSGIWLTEKVNYPSPTIQMLLNIWETIYVDCSCRQYQRDFLKSTDIPLPVFPFRKICPSKSWNNWRDFKLQIGVDIFFVHILWHFSYLVHKFYYVRHCLL